METLHKNLIHNKRVVIVGGAPYLENKNFGDIIDSYDTVIRVNASHSLTNDISKKDYGSRTDILYHCLCSSMENGGIITKELVNKIQLLVGTIPPLKKNEYIDSSFRNGYEHMYRELQPFVYSKFTNVSKDEYISLENEIGCRPWTGVSAIHNILNQQPRELYITGFTNGFGGNNKNIDKSKTQLNYSSYMQIIESAGYYKCHDAYKLFTYSQKNLLHNDIIALDKEFIDILNLPIRNKEELFRHMYNYPHH
jgi:hypothetical protein